jgi:hypothetical protein
MFGSGVRVGEGVSVGGMGVLVEVEVVVGVGVAAGDTISGRGVTLGTAEGVETGLISAPVAGEAQAVRRMSRSKAGILFMEVLLGAVPWIIHSLHHDDSGARMVPRPGMYPRCWLPNLLFMKCRSPIFRCT